MGLGLFSQKSVGKLGRHSYYLSVKSRPESMSSNIFCRLFSVPFPSRTDEAMLTCLILIWFGKTYKICDSCWLFTEGSQKVWVLQTPWWANRVELSETQRLKPENLFSLLRGSRISENKIISFHGWLTLKCQLHEMIIWRHELSVKLHQYSIYFVFVKFWNAKLVILILTSADF